MAKLKTGEWIAKLSPCGKEVMHYLLKYINTKEASFPGDVSNVKPNADDIEALTTIAHRLKLQISREQINEGIAATNKFFKINIGLME